MVLAKSLARSVLDSCLNAVKEGDHAKHNICLLEVRAEARW
jgi:hypothetical protein